MADEREAFAAAAPAAEEIIARDAAPPFLLALDIGSSSVRAGLYDATGRRVLGTEARIARRFQVTPDGGAEADAEDLLADVAGVVDMSLARAAAVKLQEIEAVSVACFWHSLTGVSAEGEPLTPVFGWADMRAAREAQELRQRFDERATRARTGCRFHAGYWPAKLLWLRATRPDIAWPTTRWLSFADYLALRLFGAPATSVSMASGTGLFDQRRCAWDEELIAALEIDADSLAPLAADGETFSGLSDEHARRWPALKRARWFPAIGDGATNNIGAGCATRARIALMVGTSGALRAVYEGEPPLALPASLWCYRADRRRIVVGGALSDGGGLFHWLRDALSIGADDAETERALAAMQPDAHGLTIMPFWAGERSTGWSAHARGAILGLTMGARPLEILRAGMEAVAYRFMLVAEALESIAPGAELRASGGALRASPAWAQMLADALAKPVALTAAREASSRGAVLLALEAMGKLKSIADAPASLARVYEPQAERAPLYRAGLARQQMIYDLLTGDERIARALASAGGDENQVMSDE